MSVLTGAGVVISAIGASRVFVREDLEFLGTSAGFLKVANPRLIPLVAHDRASLGGMLLSCGLAVWFTAQWAFRGGERVPAFKDAPTFKELGYPGIEYYNWAGLFGPKTLPAPIVDRLRAEMKAVMADPDWQHGRYFENGAHPHRGLAVARMAAHITYLSDAALHRKFGRKMQDRDLPTFSFDADFQVESYLRHQGQSFVDRFDANTYLLMTKALDYFDPARDHGDDLVAALESVGRGESLLDPAVTEKVLDRVRRIATGAYTDELAQLTQQEQKILALVAEGKTNKEIAAEFYLSDKTVKNYVSSILSKLNLQRRAQAAAFVAKHKPGSSY